MAKFNKVLKVTRQKIITEIPLVFDNIIFQKQLKELEKEDLSFSLVEFIEGVMTFKLTFEGI